MSIDRRTVLKEMIAATAASYGLSASAYARPSAQAPPAPAPGADPFFPGFKTFDVATSGATIHGVIGGSGPPILLLHGAPQSHFSWRIVAPQLAQDHTVVAPDLRGYGDSSK